MKPQALAPQTGRLIEAISRLECIKPFVLVGGTALSIQLKTRQSEDLDFMRWKECKDINTLIPRALEHSGHKLKSKGLMAMLSNGALFKKDEHFMQLQPVYDVSSSDIEAYIKSLLMAK